MKPYVIGFSILILLILLGTWLAERGMDYVILHPEAR